MEKEQNDSAYKKTIQVLDSSDEIKTQYSIDLTEWDQAKMPDYDSKKNPNPKRGYSCKIATLKPSKKYPKGRIDIDPSNAELRQAIFDMYQAYDKVKDKK